MRISRFCCTKTHWFTSVLKLFEFALQLFAIAYIGFGSLQVELTLKSHFSDDESIDAEQYIEQEIYSYVEGLVDPEALVRKEREAHYSSSLHENSSDSYTDTRDGFKSYIASVVGRYPEDYFNHPD